MAQQFLTGVKITAGDENTLYLNTGATGQETAIFYQVNGSYKYEQRVGTNFELYNYTTSSWDFHIQGSTGRLGLKTTSPLGSLHINNTSETSDRDGTATMTTSGQDSIVLYGHGGFDTRTHGSITWMGGSRRRAMITAVAENNDSDFLGLAFYTRGTDGAGDMYETMRLKHNGTLQIGTLTSGRTGALIVNQEGGVTPVAKFMSRTNKAIVQVSDNDTTGYISSENGHFSLGRNAGVNANNLNINSSNNIGIGTTSQTRQLHLKRTTGDVRGIMVETTVAASYAELHVKAAREWRIGTGGSSTTPNGQFYIYDATAGAHRLDIDSSGNVGLGQTTGIDANLHITSTNPNIKFERAGVGKWTFGIPSNATYLAFDETNDDLSTPTMVLTKTTKNVGIGITAPTDGDSTIGDPRLHVKGADGTGKKLVARFQGASDSNDSYASIMINHANDRGVLLSGGRASSNRAIGFLNLIQYDGNELTDGITLYQPNSASSGDTVGTAVGIGTSSPGSRFEVLGGGTGTNDIDRYVRFKSSNDEKRFDFYIGGTGNSSRLSMFDHDGTTEGARINSAGDSWLKGGVLTVGPGTTGSPYDSTTFLHVKGTTRSIVQQSSTADAYYMFGDAAANNVAWIGYNHSSNNLNLQSASTITLYKPTDIVGNLSVNGNIILTGASNEIIKSNGSVRINIDSNDDQTDRVFIVSKHNNSELFRVDESGHTLAQGVVKTDGYFQVNSSTTLLRKYVPSWSSGVQSHDIIYNGWLANTGDYTYLKAAGNSTGSHGAIIAADLGTYLGTTNLETGAISDSATAPLDNTWAYFRDATAYIKGDTTFGGDVTISGDLNITGDINSTSVTNLDVDDKTITVAKGAADSAAADGAGIVVDGASASLLYDHTGTQWESNKPFEVKVGSSAITLTEYSNGAAIWLDGSNGDFIGGDYFGVHAYGTTGLSFSYGAATKMTMGSDGYVAIGSHTPTLALDVKGTTNLASRFMFTKDLSTDKILFGGADHDTFSAPFIGSSSNHTFTIAQNGGAAITIDTSKDSTFAGHLKLNTGKALRLYNAAGNGWAEMAFNESLNMLQIQRGLVASGDSSLNLGTSSVRWANVWADNFNGGSMVTGTGANNYLAIWNGTTGIDHDTDFYVDSNTLYTTNLRITSDNGFFRETINSNSGGESWNASNGWHRIIEISGGSGRGKCHFLIQTGGGSGTPCRVEAIVNTAWSNANSTLTILHNSYPNFITDIRVVRNSTSGKSFVDIKGTGEDYVDVTILPDGSTSAALVNFTNVNTLPSGDSKQIEKTITNMIMSLAAGTGANTSGWTPFQVKYDGSIFAEKLEVNGGQIITPSGVNLALNPNTGVVSVGGVIQASGTGNNTFAGTVKPTGNGVKDLGGASNRWATVYASNINTNTSSTFGHDIVLDDHIDSSPNLYFYNQANNYARLFFNTSNDLIFKIGTSTELTLDGDSAIFGGKISSPHIKYCSTSISNSYVRVYFASANTSQLATAVRLTGTAHGNSHVSNFTADILVNHYQDVNIISQSGAYTQVTLKVESNNNGDYTLSVKSASSNAATYYFKVEAISDNVDLTTLPSSTSATNTTHEHTTVFGTNKTAEGGNIQHKVTGSLRVDDGNNYVEISEGSNSIGQIELHDSTSVFLQGWGSEFRVAVNGAYDQTALKIESNKNTTLYGTLDVEGTGTSSVGGDLKMLSGTGGTTAKIIFQTTDNNDQSKFIRTNAYWNEYGAHANEGHKFIDSSGNVLLQLNGGNSSSGNGALSVTTAGDFYTNNTTINSLKALNLSNRYQKWSFELPYFTHNTANLAADIQLPNEYINGLLELRLQSGYSHQNAVGDAYFKWVIGLNPSNSVWYTPKLVESFVTNQAASQIFVDDPVWDSSASKYRIRVYHKNNQGNQWEGTLTLTSQGGGTIDGTIAISNLLTSTSTTNTHPVGKYYSDNTGDVNLTLKSQAAGDPTIIMDSQAANRSGIIRYQDNGTNIGRIQYNHNGDTLHFQAGSATGYALELANNGTHINTDDLQVGTHLANYEAGFGTSIAGKAYDYGAEFQATNASIQVVLGRNNGSSIQGRGGIGADATNAFAVWNTTSTGRRFEVAHDGSLKIHGNTLPDDNDSFDLGGSGKRWSTIYGTVVDATYLRASQSSTSDPVLRLTDTGVANYDVTFPNISTIQLSTDTTSNKTFKLHNAGSGTFSMDIEGDLTVGGNINHPVDLIVNTITAHNARTKGTSANEEFPIGHWNEGEEVFSIDPTWSQTQLQNYFGSSNVEWYEDSTAPSGYAIKITGSTNVGVDYGSGFPHIAIEEDAIYYMEVHIRGWESNTVVGHYMGSIDVEHDFSSPSSGSGNPGSYGYWVMGNTGSNGTSWSKRTGIIRGFSDTTTGAFETDAKYWTPQALFNYSHGAGTRACVISGWRVVKISKQRMLTDGSIAAPSLTFAEDQNTGIYRPANDQLGFSVGGSRKMYMSATKTFFQNQANGVEINNGLNLIGGQFNHDTVATVANGGNTGDDAFFIKNGKRLLFDQSGTRSWTMKAAGGNLNVYSGDGSGKFSTSMGIDVNGTSNFNGHQIYSGRMGQELAWNQSSNATYQWTSPNMYYKWIKIATFGGDSKIRIEYLCHGDANYPRSCHGEIDLTTYNSGSINVKNVLLTERQHITPKVRVRSNSSGNNEIWIQMHGSDWSHYFVYRAHILSGTNAAILAGTAATTLTNDNAPGDSVELLPGEARRLKWQDITSTSAGFSPTGHYSGNAYEAYCFNARDSFKLPSGGKMRFDHNTHNHTYIMEEGDNNLKFYVGGTERANFGGGTNTLAQATVVNGTLTVNPDADSKVVVGNAGTNATSIYAGSGDELYLGSNNANVLRLVTGGNIEAVGDVIAYSDAKLKTNVKTLDGSKVYDMRGVSFTRLDNGNDGSGVIAQEMQKVAPELVNESSDGTLGVSYGNITGYLIEAIKDLKQEITELKKQINNG